jgi:diguanylate cyclase (GGDEF)-like protein/PAS domain S-box-containing protein
MSKDAQFSILLIEDDPGDAGLIHAYLRQALFDGAAPRIRQASTLAEANQLLEEGRYDLLLLDLGLPDSSGLATVTAIHSRMPETPIVVLSGHRDVEFETSALEAGAQDYLVKGDFNAEQIARAIRHARTRTRLEARLRLQEIALRAVANGIVITDPDARIQWANPAFSMLTGYSQNEVLGHKPRELVRSGHNDPLVYEQLWKTITSGHVWRGELVNRRKDGGLYHEEISITPVLDARARVMHYVAVKQDISERKATEERVRQLAFFDALTGLPNRRLLMDRLHQALAATARNPRSGALLFIDLDNFKSLNDTLGHDVGDRLLVEVGKRLLSCVREGDTVARLGGDEFVVMLEDLNTQEEDAAAQAEIVGEKILNALNRPYQLGEHEQSSTPSIGITLFNRQNNSLEEVLKRADLAMYQAKDAGRNTLRFFDREMQARVEARSKLERELRRALRAGQFLLYYQPQVDTHGRVIGAEALLRWLHPKRGLVGPDAFIPLAEDTGLILPLGQWVLLTACRQLHTWSGQPECAHLSLSVNVSARQFRHPDFAEQVLAILHATQANPARLKLELTESLLLDDLETTGAKMAVLKTHGIGFALDDFGTGYSALSYLKRLPLDQLKIDRCFIKDVLTDPNDAAIARTIVALGQSLGLPVIAEGVETEAQRDFLMLHHCADFQGFLFGKPMPVEDFMEHLVSGYTGANSYAPTTELCE